MCFFFISFFFFPPCLLPLYYEKIVDTRKFYRLKSPNKREREMDSIADGVVRGLQASSLAVVDHFLGSSELVSAMRSEMKGLLSLHSGESISTRIGCFQQGELAGGDGFWQTKYDATKRNDYIYWLSKAQLYGMEFPALRAYYDRAVELLRRIEVKLSPGELGLGGPRVDGDDGASLSCDRMMLAVYPIAAPSRFALHVDNPNDNGRIITFTFYLNESWDSSLLGGQLRIAEDEVKASTTKALIDPVADRLVIFYSDRRVPHEVLQTKCPTERDVAKEEPFRYSVTLWFSWLSAEQKSKAYKGAFGQWLSKLTLRREKNEQNSVQK